MDVEQQAERLTRDTLTATTTFVVGCGAALIPGAFIISIPVALYGAVMAILLRTNHTWEQSTETLRKWWWYVTLTLVPFALLNQTVSVYSETDPLNSPESYLQGVAWYVLPVGVAVFAARSTWRLRMSTLGSLSLTVYLIPGLHLNVVDGGFAILLTIAWWLIVIIAGLGLLLPQPIRWIRNTPH